MFELFIELIFLLKNIRYKVNKLKLLDVILIIIEFLKKRINPSIDNINSKINLKRNTDKHFFLIIRNRKDSPRSIISLDSNLILEFKKEEKEGRDLIPLRNFLAQMGIIFILKKHPRIR